MEGFSSDAEPTDESPSTFVAEQEPAVDQPDPVVDDAVPAEHPAEQFEASEPFAMDGALPAASEPPGDSEAVEKSPAADANAPRSEPAMSEPEPEVPSEPAMSESEPTSMRPVAPQGEVTVSHPTALYFLTNRMNLNGVLSSRLVAPRESYGKYYIDLLEQVPGWVPLLAQSPSQALIEAVTAERGAGTPVLIEFPVSVVKTAELKASVVYLPALALSQAVAIHFREERDLREHRARGYKNVHPHDELLKVTPDLFAGDGHGQVVLTAPVDPSQVSWKRIDRIRGAINGALAAVQSGEQLAVAAAFLGEVKFPASVSLPDWISWREVDDHDTAPDCLAPDVGVPDHVGFRAVYEVLGDQDATVAWSPNAVLDTVASRIREAGLEAESADALIRNLQRVRSIVNVEVDFEPFRPTARALVSAKALLLVLLRSELEELLAWSDEQTGADDLTRVTAAVLAGRLRGLSRESTTLRSLALDDLTADWAVRVARGEAGALGQVRFSATARGTSLKLDGVELSGQGAFLPDPMAKYKKVADAKKEAVRIAVSRAVGWPVTHRINVPSDAATSEDGGVLTIRTPGEVELAVSVDEEEFLAKLDSLGGSAKHLALAAFDLRKR
ncbi:hypothetical protein [Nocardioides sp.]|uniref:hypothetical protein n=1 Tax=Nocardioides sp. TaxID=35761 RepID=UPI002CEBAFB0|nr:hypothetical protein [Nocardioides sp.]HXH78424.1 hypothetical protein [Nocardioides sp.]